MTPESESPPAAGEETPVERDRPEPAPLEVPPRPVEPTRYGDWEKAGRCIDF